MTAREVIECVKRIMARRNAEAKFEATIHGAKIEEKKDTGTKLNAEEAKQADRSMARMVQEKQEEIARKKQGMKNGK